MTKKTLSQAMDEAIKQYVEDIEEHSDGPLSDMFTTLCNCGKQNRYFHSTDDGHVISCNKYVVCEPYDVIEDELRQINMKYHSLIKLSKDILIFREGTSHYVEAERQINNLIKEYEGN